MGKSPTFSPTKNVLYMLASDQIIDETGRHRALTLAKISELQYEVRSRIACCSAGTCWHWAGQYKQVMSMISIPSSHTTLHYTVR